MKTVGAFEAKTHLSRLLEEVEKGERITITRHGVPVAVLSPVSAREQRPVSEVVAEFRRASEGRALGKTTLRELIREGRS